MRAQKKNSKLKSLIELPKHKPLHINPQFDFGIRHSFQPQSVCKKIGIKTIQCRTQESSPHHSQIQSINPLPQLNFTKSSNFLLKNKEPKVMGSKTVNFLDNLINILKEDEVFSLKLDNRKRISTQQSCSNPKNIPKKPKIVRNHMTRKFFEPVCFNRQIQSQECPRRQKNANEKAEQFTFYGKKLLKEEGIQFEISQGPKYNISYKQ